MANDGIPSPAKKPRLSGQRARVTRACDRCKKRKIKCNGRYPCEFCSRAEVDCTFESSYARGRLPSIPPASEIEPAQHAVLFNKSPSTSGQRYSSLSTTRASQHVGASTDNPSTSYPAPDPLGPVADSPPTSPKSSQNDLHGHYIGPASGLSFLLRVQKRLDQAESFSHPTSIFTFGDAPLRLPDFNPSFCMMLPRDAAQRLLDRYFDFAMPTYRFHHRPTIQKWFVEFYDTLGVMQDVQKAPAKVALLFMLFAHGRVYMPDDDRPGPSDLSARYYLAAEHQLGNEKGSICLTSVQARLTQCFYLLTQSRINHCWSLFGTVSHLVLATGLNRNKRSEVGNGLDQIEAECRRRTFWCAYTLDVYLSVVLGRPRLFHDDDIDTELPACIEDEALLPDHDFTSSHKNGQSIMLAPVAHMELARIIAKVLRDLYSIKPISADRRAVLTERISKELSGWRVDLARFLDADHFNTSFLIPIFQRQRNVLNLTYWHAVILTHRPSVLSNFAGASQRSRGEDQEASPSEENVQQCLTAAMNTVNTINDMTQNRQMFRAFWTAAYFAFTANTVLYIYVIQKRASPPEVYREYLAAATRCQSHIACIADKGSLSERYYLLLEELRVEALRQTDRSHPSTAGPVDVDGQSHVRNQPATSVPVDTNLAATTDYADMLGEVPAEFDDMMFGSVTSDYSGWGQFASMVSSGLGNLDVFLNDDPFRL